MPARLPVASLAALAAALLCARAHPAAAGEDDRSLSVSASYATYSIPDHAPSGAALGLEYEHGFSDAMSFRVNGGGGVYFANLAKDEKTSYSTHATVGLTYIFDVVRYVPYASVGVGGISDLRRRPGRQAQRPGRVRHRPRRAAEPPLLVGRSGAAGVVRPGDVVLYRRRPRDLPLGLLLAPFFFLPLFLPRTNRRSGVPSKR